MFKLKVKNKQNELKTLTNSKEFEVVEIEGLLPSQAIINSTTVAGNDGEMFNSSRLGVRDIEITFQIKHPVEKNRLKLYEYFPVKKNVRLHYSNGSRSVYIDGRVMEYDGSLFDRLQMITVTLRCLQPYFKNANNTVVDNAQILDLFEFPFEIEETGDQFSVIDTTITQTVLNAGDTETGLIIEMSAIGEVVNPRIYNALTHGVFGFNLTMQLGDLITINTIKNQTSVTLTRDGETINAINSVMKSPEWFKLAVGDNVFSFQCDSGQEFLKLRFIHTDLYQGV